MQSRICPVCGRLFSPTYSAAKFCSRECFGKSMVKTETRICESCHKPFKCKPSDKRRFCSNECKRRPDATKRMTYTCVVCGVQFENWTYRKSRTCSRKCASALSKGVPHLTTRKPESYVTIYCEQCGKEYIVHKFFAFVRNSRFCSNECKYKWSSENITGHNHHTFKGGTKFPNRGANWRGQRRLALKRDAYTCQICGRKSKGNKKRVIEVHHITPYKEFNGDYLSANALSNLITLCRKCHAKIDRRGYPCPRPLF